MANSDPYRNDAERRQHSKAIRMLAEDLGMPEEKIRSVYEAIYSIIGQGARVRDYLAILICRNVRDYIRKGQYWSR
jgi:hypothetical protein